MCGIIGIVSQHDVVPRVMEALGRLEYRGYDSAGVATLKGDAIERRRAEGKLVNLARVLDSAPLSGTVGIGHTRWATHGAPSEQNAHPHGTARVSVVHNGIVENYAELRAELERMGAMFETETDTEAVAHLLDWHLAHGALPEEATRATLRRLHGTFAIAAIFAGQPRKLIAARRGSPLAVGYGEGEMFVGSDALALAPLTRRLSYLEDGDWVVLGNNMANVYNADDQPVERVVKTPAASVIDVTKGGYRHFMEKELHEHPAAIGDTLRKYVDPSARSIAPLILPFDSARLTRLRLSGCGSAFFACQTARYWIEELAHLPVDCEVASELRYRNPPLVDGGAALFVSQSGETADNLAAIRMLRGKGQAVVSIANVEDCTMSRESDTMLMTIAGPEISVASTKAFTAQLAVLACLALHFARVRGYLAAGDESRFVNILLSLPELAMQVLDGCREAESMAAEIVGAKDVLYLGRNSLYPIAMEGALKLKELSYIHAEGFAAGEMKHGPIALIDRSVPVVAMCPSGPLFEKTASNLQEAVARGGRVMVLADREAELSLRQIAEQVMVLPTVDPFVAPFLHVIAMQMLAYCVAVLKGTDVDQPRNLAKAVTVE